MKSKTIVLLLLTIGGVVLFGLHLRYFHTGVDYHYSFRPSVETWWQGQPVYTAPYYNAFNAPWVFLFLTPLEWLTSNGAEAGLALLTVVGIIGLWRVYARGYHGYALPISLALAIANLHTFDLLFRGQVDVFVMLGVMCIFEGHRRDNPYWVGVGWFLGAVRPTGIFLLLGYSVWLAYRRKNLLRTAIIPAVLFFASLVIFGFDWPLRYYTMIRFASPPQPGPWLVSWWHAANFLGISSIVPDAIALIMLAVTIYVMVRFQPDLRLATVFLVAASLSVTPYVLSYHYCVLLAMAFPVLLTWRLRLAIPLFVLMLTPLIRVYNLDAAWIDIVLPVAIWLMMIWMIRTKATARSTVAKFTAGQSQLAPSS